MKILPSILLILLDIALVIWLVEHYRLPASAPLLGALVSAVISAIFERVRHGRAKLHWATRLEFLNVLVFIAAWDATLFAILCLEGFPAA